MFKKILCIIPIVIGCEASSLPKTYTCNVPSNVTENSIIPIAIDVNFSPDENHLLQDAIKEWNWVLNGQTKLKIYTDHFNMEDSTLSYIYNSRGFMLLKVSSLGSVMHHMEENTVAISSHIGTGHEIFFLKEKVGIDRIREVALHEMGHILGAYHADEGLMQHQYSKINYNCVDYNAAKQVATYRGLNINKMNWCQ